MDRAARTAEDTLPLPMIRPTVASTVADQVFQALQQRILTLELPPRTRISEVEVAKRMGVSRQPVREAFKRLAKLGFLLIRPQSSTTVSLISEEAVLRARFIRTALEVKTCRTACEVMTDAGRASLAALIDRQRAAVEMKDRDLFHSLDDQFHREICLQSGVGYVWDLIHDSKSHMDRIRMLSLNTSSQQLALDEHIAIFDAISEKDPDAAEQAIDRHLSRIPHFDRRSEISGSQLVRGFRPMTRIVAIGEAMVEMAPSGDLGEYRLGFAGDTMNTAWYLRQLCPEETAIDYLTAVGTDAISDQLAAFLQGQGIGTGYIMRQPDRTVGLYMIQLKNGERSFAYWRGESAARRLASDPGALDHALDGATMAYFSGITVAILPKDDIEHLYRSLRQFRANGGLVAFDPNLRPRLWAGRDEMTTTTMVAAAVSDIVLPSFEDEATWFSDKSPLETAQRYAQLGCRCVIVKNGPGKILALNDNSQSVRDPIPVEQVIDTTAAGDSFNAGFLAGRTERTIGRSLDLQRGLAGVQGCSGARCLGPPGRRTVSYRGAMNDLRTIPVGARSCPNSPDVPVVKP